MNEPSSENIFSKLQIRRYSVTQNPKLIFIILTILVAVPFLIGKYIEFNTPSVYDIGAYIYSAKHIIFGIKSVSNSGKIYHRNGYVQEFVKMSYRRKEGLKYPWERVGEYIQESSQPTDKIYVWGWYPGIYVVAQRFSSVPTAFVAEMHTFSPQELSEAVREIPVSFKEEMPKFIVDTRKRHFPWDRPPLELWPRVRKGFMGTKKRDFLPLDKNAIAEHDKEWSKFLKESFGEDEALRYEAMKPFREFVMKNYKIVKMFGKHVLFELKRPDNN